MHNNTFLEAAETEILQSRRQVKKSSCSTDAKVRPLRSNALLVTDALELYLKEHADFAKRTKADYRDHFRYLQEWASEEGFPLSTMADFSVDIAKEYRAYMIEELGRSTVNIRLRTLKAFLLHRP